jgi:hypothetical protein
LKRKEFFVRINGTEWKDQYSIEVKNPNFIKVIRKVGTKVYDLFGVIDRSALNILSLSFVANSMRFCLTYTINLTL